MVRCINCNWIAAGQFYSTVLSAISNHNFKARHERPRFTVSPISDADFKAYKRLKNNPRFWEAFNGGKPKFLCRGGVGGGR